MMERRDVALEYLRGEGRAVGIFGAYVYDWGQSFVTAYARCCCSSFARFALFYFGLDLSEKTSLGLFPATAAAGIIGLFSFRFSCLPASITRHCLLPRQQL